MRNYLSLIIIVDILDCIQSNNSLNYHNNNQHTVLLYYSTKIRDAYIINYINEGLNKNELCVYGTVDLRDKETLEIAPRIIDYDKNITENNLIVFDLAPFYIAALTNDLRIFEKMKKEINEKIKNRKNKQIRFVGDCVSFLFENKHFAQCILLESWWHQRPLEGSYLCPYQKSNLDKYPFNLHKDDIIREKHDIVIDVDKSILSELRANETERNCRNQENIDNEEKEEKEKNGRVIN